MPGALADNGLKKFPLLCLYLWPMANFLHKIVRINIWNLRSLSTRFFVISGRYGFYTEDVADRRLGFSEMREKISHERS